MTIFSVDPGLTRLLHGTSPGVEGPLPKSQGLQFTKLPTLTVSSLLHLPSFLPSPLSPLPFPVETSTTEDPRRHRESSVEPWEPSETPDGVQTGEDVPQDVPDPEEEQVDLHQVEE